MMLSIQSPPRANQHGFTLLEMAVVMVILGLLLGGLLGPLASQRESKNLNTVNQQLLEIHDALLGYAAVNGFLPCPSRANSSGLEARNGAGRCQQEHGFVPIRTLGLQGPVDSNTRLLDPWLVPIRYSLTSVGTWEYARGVQLNGSASNYRVCGQSVCSEVLADNVVAVIFSLGENGNLTTTSVDELENTDGDDTFVSRVKSEASGSEFNDTLRWLSPNILMHQLVKAGRL
ncbi:type II secretion system protein [Saccharophagus degradans]|uniref:type II secretion system protein n=1 Tax=Saccharophagus degradans TaxID=86304 RepID=UPI000039110B|nr:type II secretion system protein [Saccharophagus degradans]